MIEQLIQQWSGEMVITQYDTPTGAWLFIAIHSTKLGPAGGGTRMKHYSTPAEGLQDALRLAEAMTYKSAVSGLNEGGGKAVIAVPAELSSAARTGLLRRYGKLVKQLGGLFLTGPDFGTTTADMATIAETGAPHIACVTDEDSTSLPTALGVFAGMKVVSQELFGTTDLTGRRVLVQGVGGVGALLVALLQQAGAEVLFSEVEPHRIAEFRDKRGLPFVHSDEVYQTTCDIFAPCALGGVLNETTIPHLDCRAVVGAANNQLARSKDAQRLFERGILYAPDYVVNAGGVISVLGSEEHGWTHEQMLEEVPSIVQRTLQRVLTMSAQESVNSDIAARQLATERLNS